MTPLRAVVYFDLDGFKDVNDSAGHGAGDAVLGQVAQIVRRAARASDDVVRVGGDEFVLLLRSCTTADARRIAEKIVGTIEATLFEWNDSTFRIGASAGIAMTEGATPAAIEAAIAHADRACYRAKREGGHRVAVDRAIPDGLGSLEIASD